METPSPSPQPPLAAYLAEHDAPCPRCGYNLRGCAGERCPECEWRLDLGRLQHPMKQPTWLVALGLFLGCVVAWAMMSIKAGGAGSLAVSTPRWVFLADRLVWWFVLLGPAVWWFVVRRKIWVQWTIPAHSPWNRLAWAVLVLATLQTSQGITKLIDWYARIFGRPILGPVPWTAMMRMNLAIDVLIFVGSLTIYLAMLKVQEPAALGKWARRGLLLCLAFAAWLQLRPLLEHALR